MVSTYIAKKQITKAKADAEQLAAVSDDPMFQELAQVVADLADGVLRLEKEHELRRSV